MIKIENLHKAYQTGEVVNPVLKGLDFAIEEGEFVVILGPSGCGKSTLLNCISGLETVDKGAICYDGADIVQMTDRELTQFRRTTTAFIFQNYYLMPSLSVAANIKMGANHAIEFDARNIHRHSRRVRRYHPVFLHLEIHQGQSAEHGHSQSDGI